MSDSSTSTPAFQSTDYCVYVIQAASGPIKIGVSNDIGRRLAALQTGHYETLTLVCTLSCSNNDAAAALEKALHRKYKSRRLRGEWFSVTPDEIIGDIQFAVGLNAIEQNLILKEYGEKQTTTLIKRALRNHSGKRTGETYNAVSLINGAYVGTCPYCSTEFPADTHKGAANALSAHIGRWCEVRNTNGENGTEVS